MSKETGVPSWFKPETSWLIDMFSNLFLCKSEQHRKLTRNIKYEKMSKENGIPSGFEPTTSWLLDRCSTAGAMASLNVHVCPFNAWSSKQNQKKPGYHILFWRACGSQSLMHLFRCHLYWWEHIISLLG